MPAGIGTRRAVSGVHRVPSNAVPVDACGTDPSPTHITSFCSAGGGGHHKSLPALVVSSRVCAVLVDESAQTGRVVKGMVTHPHWAFELPWIGGASHDRVGVPMTIRLRK